MIFLEFLTVGRHKGIKNMQLNSFIKKVIIVFILIFMSIGLAKANDGHIKIAGKIIVQGNQRIERDTILSYMMIKEGFAYDVDAINNSLKNLFATGLFADITIKMEGSDLLVNVVENPVINRVSFEGNARIKNEILESETSLKPRSTYTRAKVQTDLERIMEVYRRSGMFGVNIEPKIIERPQNRVDLVF